MKKLLSGSTENIVSSMHFLDNGEIVIENFESGLNPYDEATLMMSHEFIHYALNRQDWMKQFLFEMQTNLEREKKKTDRMKFTVIDGGLS